MKQKKERKNKGKSVNAYVSDYCVVDIETTDSIPNGEIIEIGAIKVQKKENKYSGFVWKIGIHRI